MQDVRLQLIRSKTVRQVLRRKTKNLTVHWNGPSVAKVPKDLTLLKADARFHVETRGWDGLSYHYGVGRDGQQYWCRDQLALLAHSGVAQGNNESYSVLIITGEGDNIPPIQYVSLEDIIRVQNIAPRWVLGHQEWPRLTACPGPLLMRWLAEYRGRYRAAGATTTLITANVRDESSVLSHKTRELAKNTPVVGTWMLGKPFKGDALWFQLQGTTDYLHGSVIDTKAAPIWTK